MQVEDLSTLITRELETTVEDGDHALVINRFNLFDVCIRVSNRRVAITQGLEQLAAATIGCIYRSFYRLTVTSPTSSALEAMHRCYRRAVPYWIDFTGDAPPRYTMVMIHALVKGDWNPRPIWHDGDRPSDHEHIRFARDIVELAQVEYRRQRRVPGWILGFTFDSLSLDPLPSATVLADCLKIIAIGLGCDISDVAASDERCVCLSLICIHRLTRVSAQAEVALNLITRELTAMVKTNRAPTISKCEATCALIPYAIFLEQLGQQGVTNAIMHTVRASRDYYFMSSIPSYITALFRKPSSPFRNWLITLVALCVDWTDKAHGEDAVAGWAAAVSTVPDTEEVVRSVVGTLMQITNVDSLRPHIPVEIWRWIKKWQSLPLADWGRFYKATPDAVSYVRGLEDLEIIKLYIHAWLVWYFPSTDALDEVEISIGEDFGGIGMWGHREDILNWLDYVLEIMRAEEDDLAHSSQRLRRCGRLKEVVLDIDEEATKTIARKPLGLFVFEKGY